MASDCGICNAPVTQATDKYVKCNKCGKLFHIKCVNIKDDEYKEKYQSVDVCWLCVVCDYNKDKKEIENCSECSKAVNKNDSSIRCSNKTCNRLYHLNCSGYNKKLLGSANESIRSKWECNFCFELQKCRVCELSFKRRDKRVLCTGTCKRYYHVSCLDISIEEFENQFKDKESTWICFPCSQPKVDAPKSADMTDNNVDELTKLKQDNEALRLELKSINEVLVCLSTELVEQRRLVKESEAEVLNLSEAILIKEEELLELHEICKGIVPFDHYNDKPSTSKNKRDTNTNEQPEKSPIPIIRNNLQPVATPPNKDYRKGKNIVEPNPANTNCGGVSNPSGTNRQPRRHRYHSRRQSNDFRSSSNEVLVKMPSENVFLHVEGTDDSCARLQMRNTRPGCYSVAAAPLKTVATQTDYETNYGRNFDVAPVRPTFFLDNHDDYFSPNRDNTINRGTCTASGGPVSPAHSDRSARSPVRSPRGRDLHRSTNCLPGSPYLSPCTPTADKVNVDSFCNNSVSNTQIKQYIYREELKKQIEERQRLEAERKEREKREEEAMDRRVKEQQEKLRKQYEIEEAQRLEYALRRHIQDDALRQRLAEGDSASMHHRLHNVNLIPAYTNRQRPTVLCNRNIAPFVSPDDRPLPLPDKTDKQKGSGLNGSTNPAASETQGVLKTSKPVQLRRSNSDNNPDSVKNIDPLIGVDLLADEGADNNNVHDLLPEEKPLLNEPEPLLLKPEVPHNEPIDDRNEESQFSNNNDNNAFLQSRERSESPPVPALQTRSRIINSNTQVLQDKWQVPAVEKMYIKPNPVRSSTFLDSSPLNMPLSSAHLINMDGNRRDNYHLHSIPARSDNVLTQLGSFRRQLQLEQLRMQDRLYHSQAIPRTVPQTRVKNK